MAKIAGAETRVSHWVAGGAQELGPSPVAFSWAVTSELGQQWSIQSMNQSPRGMAPPQGAALPDPQHQRFYVLNHG